MLQLWIGRDWTANREEIFRAVSRDVAQRRGGRILMVPELISHDTERRLCVMAGDTASRYAEVLSFSRLGRSVAEAMGAAAQQTLDNGGRVVAMAAAARQLSSRLKAYASVETRPEFLAGLIDAVDEFKRCCISARDLAEASKSAEGSLAQKLEELSQLMEAYDSLCARGKRDPRDQMTWLLEQMEQGTYARDHVFYIDGFPDFTRQHMAILEHLICCSPLVTVSLTCDRVDAEGLSFEKAAATARQLLRCARDAGVEVQLRVIEGRKDALDPVRRRLFQGPIQQGAAKGAIRAFRAPSIHAECMAAAYQIRELVRGGCRYRDIALVCGDMGSYAGLVEMIFHRMHIPIYRSGTEDILQKSVVATVLSGAEAALSGFEPRSVLLYLRSALSPLAQDLCDEVENYAVIWQIRGAKWTQPWVNHPDGLSDQWTDRDQAALERLEGARAMSIEPLHRLRSGFLDARDLRQQVQALYTFLEEIDLANRLSELARELDEAGDNRSAQILDQLWEILLGALEQLHDVLGETVWEPEHFLRLLRLLLSQYDVGTIPPVLDAVQVGPVSAMRCHQQKHLIILGAQEGSLPGYTGSAGVLTDQERDQLRDLGVPLTGGGMEGIQSEFAEIYGVVCGAEQTVSIYCPSEQPSFVFRRLAELAGGEEQAPQTLGFAGADAMEAGAFLARWEQAEAAERLGIREAYQEILEKKGYSLGTVERESIKKLYGSTLALSASQVDRQAQCRLSYFLQYGLRAKERKEATVDPTEFGMYVHYVLEKTAGTIRERGGFHQVSLEETLALAHEFSDEYAAERFSRLESQRMEYLFHRNLQELDMVVTELWEELRASAFQPEAFEVDFGNGNGLPPIAIPNHAMNAILRGYVDRMDTWNNGFTTYYRVVDYKTGRKDLDYCDLFNGVGLQMLLYLFALRESGEAHLGDRPVPAGVQYFPARAPYLSADGKLSPEEAEKLRLKEWKRKGLLLRDEAVLQAMEPGQEPVRMCYTIKDGEPVGDLADREQLKLLEGYVFRVLARLVEDIASGNVQPNPYIRGTSHSACDYCPYGPICHRDSVEQVRNYQTMSAQQFWQGIEKEMKDHGG